jgi:hypothetical protein
VSSRLIPGRLPAELVEDAWRIRASKKLVAQYEAG